MKRNIFLLWVVYLVVSVACAAINLATSPVLNWAYWVWVGLGIGFAISTANMILNYTTCPKCGKMIKLDDMYCSRCGRKITKK